MGELHQVSMESPRKGEEQSEFLKMFNLEHLSELLSDDQRQQVLRLLEHYEPAFSKSSHDLGCTDAVQHQINLLDDSPFKERFRRIPPHMFEEVREHIQQLLSIGVIQPSSSPWASNLVLVRKKDGSLRMCIDYRKLNQRTKRDSYALPTIEELLDTLGGATWFSSLDLSSGYHQVVMDSEHRE